MANRVLLGKRGTSDFGLFVSRSGDDVTTTTNPLFFDSRSPTSLTVHSFGQGILVPSGITNSNGSALSNNFDGQTYTSAVGSGDATITHNLGYVPAYAIRWNTAQEAGFRVSDALIPTSDNDTASTALEATGPTVGNAAPIFIEFGAILDSGRTLKATGFPSSPTPIARNTNFHVGAVRSTESSSHVTMTGEFTDDLNSGTDVGVLKFRPLLSGGNTTGTYVVLIQIEDNTGQDYVIKISGTVNTTVATGRRSLKVWNVGYAVNTDFVVTDEGDEEEEEFEWSHAAGLQVTSTTTNAINIEYLYERSINSGQETGSFMGDTLLCLYSYVIFTAPNFLNNRSF